MRLYKLQRFSRSSCTAFVWQLKEITKEGLAPQRQSSAPTFELLQTHQNFLCRSWTAPNITVKISCDNLFKASRIFETRRPALSARFCVVALCAVLTKFFLCFNVLNMTERLLQILQKRSREG
jgi:hypothetical protein